MNEACFCGVDTFYVRVLPDSRNHTMIVCAGCKCERRLRTPSFAGNYVISPPLKDWTIVEKPSGQLDTMRRLTPAS